MADNPLLSLVGYSSGDDDDDDEGVAAPMEEGGVLPLAYASTENVVEVSTATVELHQSPHAHSPSPGPGVASPARSASASSPARVTRVNKSLEEKMKRYFEFKAKGKNVAETLKHSKQFKNPTIYSKLVQFCNINETGTNYSQAVFDPKGYPRTSHYDRLAAEQEKFRKELEKKRKERTAIDFTKPKAKEAKTVVTRISGTADGSAKDPSTKVRKSKWGEPADVKVMSGSHSGNHASSSSKRKESSRKT